MGEAPAAVLGATVLAEGGRRAGGGVGEVVGEAVVGDAGKAQAESLVGDAGADRKANTWERQRTPTRSQRFP